MTAEQLRRKIDQHWEMSGLARQDGDIPDSARHMKLALKYEKELKEYE